jgi:hypothetical protein
LEEQRSMRKAELSRLRPGLVACGLFLLAVASAGCTDNDAGSVPPTPKAAPELPPADASKKDSPAPRMPRGPGQVKALQESKTK